MSIHTSIRNLRKSIPTLSTWPVLVTIFANYLVIHATPSKGTGQLSRMRKLQTYLVGTLLYQCAVFFELQSRILPDLVLRYGVIVEYSINRLQRLHRSN
jgi:hypothetical protein